MVVQSRKPSSQPLLHTMVSNKNVFRVVVGGFLGILSIGFASLIYVSYQDYVHPRHVYGSWIEIGAPSYDTDKLTLNEQGVFRNARLISTSFDFDGKEIFIETGQGVTIYRLAGTPNSPQLRRVQPNSPTQRMIKEGYENTVDMEGGGPAKNRRAALSEHFNNK